MCCCVHRVRTVGHQFGVMPPLLVFPITPDVQHIPSPNHCQSGLEAFKAQDSTLGQSDCDRSPIATGESFDNARKAPSSPIYCAHYLSMTRRLRRRAMEIKNVHSGRSHNRADAQPLRMSTPLAQPSPLLRSMRSSVSASTSLARVLGWQYWSVANAHSQAYKR